VLYGSHAHCADIWLWVLHQFAPIPMVDVVALNMKRVGACDRTFGDGVFADKLAGVIFFLQDEKNILVRNFFFAVFDDAALFANTLLVIRTVFAPPMVDIFQNLQALK